MVQRMETIGNPKYHLHKTIAHIFPELLFKQLMESGGICSTVNNGKQVKEEKDTLVL